MKIIQSHIFSKKVKKLHRQDKLELDTQIRVIIRNPSVGVEKKGDLKGVFIYKFKLGSTLYLLAYHFSEDLLELIMIGTHENYYRELKQILK